MNQPTREEFEHLEEEQRQLKEEVRKLREQITEPIKITRLEIDSGSMHEQLVQANKQIDSVQEDVGVLKEEMKGARADIASLKATQSDHSAFFIEHGQRLSAIETKQDAHTEVLGKLVSFAESHDTMLKTVATKDDIRKVETAMATKDDIAGIKATQDLILQLLQQKPPES